MKKETNKKYEKMVTISAVNWQGEWGNKKANLDKMIRKIKEAAKLGINMICFPELALYGYECSEEAKLWKKPCEMHTKVAETIPGPSTELLAKLAKELDIYVIFGMPERDKQHPKLHYISATIVGPEGVIGKYRKIHLAKPPTWTEDYCFKPGAELPIFQTRYGPIGIQICADFWMFPELSRILALKGARIIFNPTGSAIGPSKISMMVNNTTTRAHETQTYIVSCNHVGKERTLTYYGHSTIAGPGFPKFFKTLSEGEDIEEIVWATVSFETLEHARKAFAIKQRANWKLIIKEYKEIANLTHVLG